LSRLAPHCVVSDSFGIGPTNVSHVSGIGLSGSGHWIIKDIPTEWKSIFREANIKPKDLRNPEAKKFIFDILAQQQLGVGGGSTPPPLPTVGHPGPPLDASQELVSSPNLPLPHSIRGSSLAPPLSSGPMPSLASHPRPIDGVTYSWRFTASIFSFLGCCKTPYHR
jgi:hypothetical protein